MAIQCKYYDSNLEVEVKDCYWKITRLFGDKNHIDINVGVYKNKDKADAGVIINEFQFGFTPELESNNNFIAQAYEYLKTLPMFESAIDV